jgi:hypothetical protein
MVKNEEEVENCHINKEKSGELLDLEGKISTGGLWRERRKRGVLAG